jgi:hypothetical protein
MGRVATSGRQAIVRRDGVSKDWRLRSTPWSALRFNQIPQNANCAVHREKLLSSRQEIVNQWVVLRPEILSVSDRRRATAEGSRRGVRRAGLAGGT